MKKLFAKLILLNCCLDFDDEVDDDTSELLLLLLFSIVLLLLLDIGGVCRLLDVVLDELLGNGARFSVCSDAVLLLLLPLPVLIEDCPPCWFVLP